MGLNSTADAVLISTIVLLLACVLTCLCLKYFTKRNRRNSDLSFHSSTTLTTSYSIQLPWRRYSSTSQLPPPPPYSPPLNGNIDESLPSYERVINRFS